MKKKIALITLLTIFASFFTAKTLLPISNEEEYKEVERGEEEFEKCQNTIREIYNGDYVQTSGTTNADNRWYGKIVNTNPNYYPILKGDKGIDYGYLLEKNNTKVILTSIPLFGGQGGDENYHSKIGMKFLDYLTPKDLMTENVKILNVSGATARRPDLGNYVKNHKLSKVAVSTYSTTATTSSVPVNLDYSSFDIIMVHVKYEPDQWVVNKALELGIPLYVSYPGTQFVLEHLATETFGVKIVNTNATPLNRTLTEETICI